MAVEQRVGGADHEVDDLAGSVNDAEAVGALGIVGLLEVFVDDLEEGLIFPVADDPGGLDLDDLVVVLDLAEGVALGRAGEEGALHFLQLAGDAVLIEELGIAEDGEEDFLGEDVLDEHLVHIGRGDGGIDGAAAEFQKGIAAQAEGAIFRLLLLDHFPQGPDDAGDVLLEALDGFLELADLGVLEGDVGGEESVELAVLREGCAEKLAAILIEDGGLGIFEQDVGVRVADIELFGDLGAEVVGGVLAFPEAVIEAEDVFQRAVRPYFFLPAEVVVIQLLDEQEIARAGVGIDEGIHGAAYGGFPRATPKSFDLIDFGAIRVDGAVIGHVGDQ